MKMVYVSALRSGLVGSRLAVLSCAFAMAAGSSVGLGSVQPGAVDAGGAQAGGADAGPYADAVLVRVTPSSVGERLAVSSLGMTMMGESERTDGVGEYLADADERAALDAAGVAYEIVRTDVQAFVDAQSARLGARAVWGVDPQPRGTDTFFEEFRDLTEIYAFLDGLVAAHPGLISQEIIGQSVQGRDIRAYTISGAGDADSKPSLIFNSGAHAREWIAPMTVLYTVRGLVEGYGGDAEITDLLDDVSFRIAPMMNPDGYLYTWSSERFWRKNRRNNGNGTFGVDWNRNFAAGWGGPGSDSSSSSDIYRGPSPFSEPESRALRDFTLSIPNGAFHIDFHSFSQLVLFPVGYTETPIPEPDLTIQRTLAEAYAGMIASVSGFDYLPIPSYELYLASGVASDWHYEDGGVYSFTVELRPGSGNLDGFAPPPAQILPCAEENFAAVLDLAGSVARGVVASFDGPQPGLVEPETATPVSFEVIPVFSGPLDASSAALFARTGSSGAFSAVPASASGDVYTATIPGAVCGEVVEYYFSIDSAGGGSSYTYPSDAPDSVFTVEAVEQAVVFEDTIETDLGWVSGAPGDDATTGQWERGDPQGTAAQPENDHTQGGSICWVTGANAGTGLGSFDVDGGTTTLTTPVLDATVGDGDAFVSVWIWFSNNTGGNPNEDTMPIDISGDGGANWVPLDEIASSTDGWEERSYRVADFVTLTDSVRLRFLARDLGDGSLVEAAVDDLRIESVGCPDSGNPADIAPPFGVLDLADVNAFVQGFLNQDAAADIAAPFGVLDLADVSLFVSSFLVGTP